MPILDNSTRQTLKATHSQVQPRKGGEARALEKNQFIRTLRVSKRELEILKKSLDGTVKLSESEWTHLTKVSEAGSTTPVGAFARISQDDLVRLGEVLLRHRSTQQQADSEHFPAASSSITQLRRLDVSEQTLSASRVANVQAALDSLRRSFAISPIGQLNLERIEMSPAGIERGELVATIALAPKESTSVVQKEWAVTNEEFSSIVTDYLETYSEKGVAEKTELAVATESQTKHSQQLGLDSSVSGSYGFVTFSTAMNVDIGSSDDKSQKESRNHASDVTSKASARVRKERKITIQTSSTKGTENTTARTLTNPSDDMSMRIDYYSMMRKWRVRLLQYGMCLTYDLTLPHPGNSLRQIYWRVAYLRHMVAQPFKFELDARTIFRETVGGLSNDYGVALPAAPEPVRKLTVGGPLPDLERWEQQPTWRFYGYPFAIDDGYKIDKIAVNAMISGLAPDGNGAVWDFIIFGAPYPVPGVNNMKTVINIGPPGSGDLSASPDFMVGRTGQQKIVFYQKSIIAGMVRFLMDIVPTEETMRAWQDAVWKVLMEVEQTKFYATKQAYLNELDSISAQLEGVDTLTLRREERDEVMRAVLGWMLGPSFEFMPDDISALFDPTSNPMLLNKQINELGMTADGWSNMARYQETVKFVHQAIEWENLLYFMYPYFWDVPVQWDGIRSLRHPDPTREQFLRAGSARVVITVRPGFEEQFLSFARDGDLSGTSAPDDAYMSIGNEMRAYNQTNYPGIAPANPERDARPLLTPRQRRAWQDIQALMKAVEDFKTSQGAYPTTLQGLSALPAGVPIADPWGVDYVYVSPGVIQDYEISTAGAPPPIEDPEAEPDEDARRRAAIEELPITSWASASLIGEWYEYTPSRGIDIQLNTALADMA